MNLRLNLTGTAVPLRAGLRVLAPCGVPIVHYTSTQAVLYQIMPIFQQKSNNDIKKIMPKRTRCGLWPQPKKLDTDLHRLTLCLKRYKKTQGQKQKTTHCI
jgi:hypothetical protein